jgi:hypothetical protein
MLLAVPAKIGKKVDYKNGEPVANGKLTEEEQKIFDEFYKTFMYEKEHRFIIDDEDGC